MFCEKCGTEIPKDAKFCEKCGTLVGDDFYEKGEKHSNIKWIFLGIAGGIVVVAVVVLVLFVTGVFGGGKENIQTSSMPSQSDTGVTEPVTSPSEQPTATPTATPTVAPTLIPTSEPTEKPTTDSEADNSSITADDINVEKEVKKIRRLYNKTQNNLDSYMSGSEMDGSTFYYKGEGEVIKISIKGGNKDWKYSREYYYHNRKLYFAFVYKGKEEHRLYFKDGNLIRYIDNKKNTYDYGDNKLSSFSNLNDKVQSESTEIYQGIIICGH